MANTPLSAILSGCCAIQHHLHTDDDIYIYISSAPDNASTSIPELQNYIKSVQAWMAENKTKSTQQDGIHIFWVVGQCK